MTAGAPKGHLKVTWTDSEWQAVALALLKAHPEYIDHPHPMIDADELRTAMTQVLAPDRHRPIPQIGGAGCSHFRPGLLKAYQFIRETLGANGRAVDPEMAALSDLTLPAPLETPRQEAPANFRNKSRIKWSPAEFLLLARYLRNRYPGANYLDSSTCVGLSLADVRDAMLAVLPRERHRNLHTITPLRNFFVSAFKAAKAEQYKETERARHEQEAQERRAQMSLAAPPPLAAPVAANPYEAVFAPLMKPFINLLAQELMAQLAPQIAQMVAAALAPPAQEEEPAPTPAPAAPSAPRLSHPAAVAPPRKVMVGVVGPLPVQRNELERAFPHLQIITLEGGNTNEAIARLRNARRVIGMTSFMNHSMDGALAKNFSDRYARVTGGVSSIKRQIQVWDASGVLAA